MARAPRIYMRVTGDAGRQVITFAVNLRATEAVYGFAFANLLLGQYQGKVSGLKRWDDPPDVVFGAVTVGFATEALYLRALLDCQTYLTRDGRVLASYRAPLTRADPRLRNAQSLLERTMREPASPSPDTPAAPAP